MEELPPTLDDGELWLPSDIFPPDDNHHQVHPNHPFGSPASSMENRSRAIVDRPPKPTSNPERLGMFGPRARYALTAPSSTDGHALIVDPPVDRGHFNLSQTGPGFQFPGHPALRPNNNNMVQPLYPRVPGQLMETRLVRNCRPLLGRQPNPSLNNTNTFEANGLVLGSPMRNSHGPSSGTGVFIPRVNTSNFKTLNTVKNFTGFKTQRISAKGPSLESGECNQDHQMSSSEVSLPKDWTY